MEGVLWHDAAILTATNNQCKTPTDLAIMCEGMLEIQTRFTVVLFNRYQIVRPQHPLYKSPTAEVHECNDLFNLASDKQQQQQQQQQQQDAVPAPDLMAAESTQKRPELDDETGDPASPDRAAGEDPTDARLKTWASGKKFKTTTAEPSPA